MSSFAEGKNSMALSIKLSRQFERQVKQWVRAVITRNSISFDTITQALPGVYPSIVRNTLNRIALRRWSSGQQNLCAPNSLSNEARLCTNTMPIPHPLDYDWRFSAATNAYLLQEIESCAAPDATVVLLGTPSVLCTASHSPNPYQYVLIEANPTMVEWFAQTLPTARVEWCMIGRDDLPSLAGSVVIADPPWYEEYLRVFLWAAAQLCHVGGTIFVSVPPLGTRPGIAQEWARSLSWAQQLGLSLVRLERTVLNYQTPPFENNALCAEGLISVNPMWRHGDLAIFTHQSLRMACQPHLPASEEMWDEVCVKGVRIRLRRDNENTFADPTLISLVDGDVLASVSRRDPRRRAVNVWTSGNRVFACMGTHILRTILQAIANDRLPLVAVSDQLNRALTALESSQVDYASHQVQDILSQERHEVRGYWEGTFYDKSVHRATYRSTGRGTG
jgi:hypothetical protein